MDSDTRSDILRGAAAIAGFLHGDEGKRKKVYHAIEKRRLPHFRDGLTICARRSTLLAWIAEQEAASLRGGA
jgi:hypothetical protein